MPEYLAENLSESFPFVDRVQSPSGLSSCIADARLVLKTAPPDSPDIELVSMSATSVLLEYVGGDACFSGGAGEFTSTPFGTFHALKWENATGQLILVVNWTLLSALLPAPAISGAVLVPGRIVSPCQALESLSYGTSPDPPFDTIVLQEGYNCRLDVEGQKITMTAEPGAGLGRYSACDEESLLYTINKIGPDADGDFKLLTDACGRIEPDIAGGYLPEDSGAQRYSGLTLHDDCNACCTCDDYVKTYRYLRRAYERLVAVYAQLIRERDALALDVGTWETEKTSREIGAAELILTPVEGWAVVVTARYVNNTAATMMDLEFDIPLPADVSLRNSKITWAKRAVYTEQPTTALSGITLQPAESVSIQAVLYWTAAARAAGLTASLDFEHPGGTLSDSCTLIAPGVNS